MAYVRAIAAAAGFGIANPQPDIDSVDGVLLSVVGRRPRIEFQAKATTQDFLRDDGVHFPLPVKNYEDLRGDTICPRILVVLVMPPANEDWVSQSEDELCLRHCAYWRSLTGEPSTTNTESVTVHLPADNVFSSTQLTGMMQRVERNGVL